MRTRVVGVLVCAAVLTAGAGCADDGAGGAGDRPPGTAATGPDSAPAPVATAPAGTPTADGSTAPAPPAPATDAAPATDREQIAVGVYFVTLAGEVVRQERLVDAGEPLRGALEQLVAGPGDPAFVAPLPAGTRLLGVSVAGDQVVVDLSAEFESGYPSGGSAAELAVVAPIVRTAADAADAAGVRITVEGRVPAPMGSQFDFSQPLGPREVG
jgi:spore germination protein GerM